MAEKTPRMLQIEEMLAENPDDEFLLYALGMEYVAQDQHAEAVETFRKLMDREYVPAFLQAGQALTRLDEIEEACTVYRQGIAIAQRKGDDHARGEMQGFLDAIE